MRLPFAICLSLVTSLCRAEAEEVDWLDLLPPQDLDATEALPDIVHDAPEGPSPFYAPGGLRQPRGLPAVMYSTATVAELDGQPLSLVGYPVPLDGAAASAQRHFYLLPYAGSCRHVPPPAPNQMVLVRYPRGFAVEDPYVPLRVSGTLKAERREAPALTAYALEADSVQLMEEEEGD